MFPENETPELSEQGKDENLTVSEEKKETPTPQEENAESSVIVNETAEEPKVEEPESPVSEEQTETSPETPGDVEVKEEGETEEPPADITESPVAESGTPADTEDASDESEESPEVAHIEAEEEDDDSDAGDVELPPYNEDLTEQVETLIADTSNLNTMDGAMVSDLIHLLRAYRESENILSHIPRVGLLKRTFDALMVSGDEFPQHHLDLFKKELNRFNRKRSEAQQKADEVKVENSRKKQELLVELEKIVDKEDPLLIKEVRAVQDTWQSIGHVLKKDIEPLYKQYRYLLDKFYKLREMHFELLDYDRRINLQEKEKLIEEAEGLIPPEEERENIDVWRERMDMLQELQQKWKSIGYVPREDLERINNAYREVIDRFFDVRQGFMEIQDQLRQENADKKTAILEQMAAFATFNAEKPREWNDATKTLRGLQDQWKQIGQAPQNVNGELWSKYKETCNGFFTRKSDFFKKYDDFRNENLTRKRELVEIAEEYAKSEDWEKTSRDLKKLQKDWKAIGPVPERHSNKLWNRFREACDKFFENRREHYQSLHQDENENLAAKQKLIDQVKKVTVESEGSIEKAIEKIKNLQGEWKNIGKVPYKEKDKIWDEFRAEIDKFFNGLDMKREQIRDIQMTTAIESVDDPDERSREIKYRISKIRRKMQSAQEKVDQYSTNIQFISKGKSGDSLRNQIQGEIDKEVKMIDEWKRKIKKLNDMLKNPPSPDDDLGEDEDDD